jgi:hypothetical protein
MEAESKTTLIMKSYVSGLRSAEAGRRPSRTPATERMIRASSELTFQATEARIRSSTCHGTNGLRNSTTASSPFSIRRRRRTASRAHSTSSWIGSPLRQSADPRESRVTRRSRATPSWLACPTGQRSSALAPSLFAPRPLLRHDGVFHAGLIASTATVSWRISFQPSNRDSMSGDRNVR